MLKVDTVRMENQIQQLQKVINDLQSVSNHINEANRSLRWHSSVEYRIRSSLTTRSSEVDSLRKKTVLLQNALRAAINSYNAAEGETSGDAADRVTTLETIALDNEKATEDEEATDTGFEWLKAFLKLLDAGEIPEAGPLGGILGYLESLANFLSGDMSGLSGMEDWFNLGDKSIGLWEAMYDWFRESGGFDTGIFSEAWQNGVNGLGLGGDLMGFISDIFGSIDAIKNGDMGAAGITGAWLESGGSAAEVIESILKIVCKAPEGEVNFTTKDGLYSPLSIYTAIAKGYLDAFGALFDGIESYYADGVWDLGDTGKVGTDFAVNGLYGMIEALTFGLISEGTTGVSAEDVSGWLQDRANDIATNATDFMFEHDLADNFNDCGPIGKTALIIYSSIADLFI